MLSQSLRVAFEDANPISIHLLFNFNKMVGKSVQQLWEELKSEAPQFSFDYFRRILLKSVPVTSFDSAELKFLRGA